MRNNKQVKITKTSIQTTIGNKTTIRLRQDIGFCPNHSFPENHWQKVTRFYKNHFIPICDECHKKSCDNPECYKDNLMVPEDEIYE